MKRLNELVFLSLVVVFLELLALLVVFRSLVGGRSNVKDTDKPGATLEINVTANWTDRAEKVDKVVLFIIDAMRYDFIEEMKFLKESLDTGDHACLFKVSLEGPTVTLPRIKHSSTIDAECVASSLHDFALQTLVTGTTSSYWDFLNNLKATTALTVDNILWKAIQNGKRIVFYGDDTWLKLFPNNLFLRAEGVTSFLVTDFYEVDNNVTKNVKTELSNGSQFDMMILHYLGVDHVGHVHGPTHSLIPEKLEEMDGIIQTIFTELQTIGEIGDLPNIMFITGDHGMANQGGHGGDSPQEVTSPMVLLTAQKGAERSPLCKKNIPGWPSEGFSMNQVDFASIVSFFWDLPYPNQAKGQVPAEILSLYPQSEQLQHMQVTCESLLGLMAEGSEKETAASLFVEYEKEMALISDFPEKIPTLIRKFETLRMYIKGHAVENFQQDTFLMASATVTIMLSILYYEVSMRNTREKTIYTFSRNFTLKGAFGLLLILAIFSACLISKNFILAFGFASSTLLCLSIKRQLPTLVNVALPKTVLFFSSLVCTHFGSTILLFSSSFVEEEHFLLHYLYTTVIVVSLVGRNPQFKPKEVLQLILLIAIHRMCGSLNSTGQKWNYVMNINDILVAMHLKYITFIPALILLSWLRLRTVLEYVITAGIVIAKTDVLSNFTRLCSSYNNTIIQFLYVLIVANVPLCGLSKPRVSYHLLNSFALFLCLLHKIENVILVPLVILQVRLIQVSNTCRPWWATGIILNSLFLTSFFYQGNSNSVTTVDISMGFVGLSSYNEYIVGVLTFVGTFSSPLLVVLTIASAQTKKLCNGQLFRTDEISLKNFLRIHTLRLSLSNFVYSLVVIFMRQHLFIWSVFVPKLMYQIAFTFLSLIVYILLLCGFPS